jgi:TonB family protein
MAQTAERAANIRPKVSLPMNSSRFWLAALLSGIVHGACVAAALVIYLWPSYTPPELIEPYGDSDREGFAIETIAVNPGAWREGDEHTPGGDSMPEVMERDDRPDLNLTPAPPEPAVELPQITVVDSQNAAPAATPNPPAPSKPTGSKLPGAPGGAHMPIGTPSAGGTVGSRTGVRMLTSGSLPVYPQAAREAGIEGTVIILLHISAEGELLEAKIHRSSGYKMLDDSALSWTRKQKFVPAKRGNTPVETEVTKAIQFYLYEAR